MIRKKRYTSLLLYAFEYYTGLHLESYYLMFFFNWRWPGRFLSYGWDACKELILGQGIIGYWEGGVFTAHSSAFCFLDNVRRMMGCLAMAEHVYGFFVCFFFCFAVCIRELTSSYHQRVFLLFYLYVLPLDRIGSGPLLSLLSCDFWRVFVRYLWAPGSVELLEFEFVLCA